MKDSAYDKTNALSQILVNKLTSLLESWIALHSALLTNSKKPLNMQTKSILENDDNNALDTVILSDIMQPCNDNAVDCQVW